LLALARFQEFSVGELAELLRQSQPKISRHAAALREAGLLTARRHGTWTLLRLAPGVSGDPVVADAIAAGWEACERDGTVEHVARVLDARTAGTREFFARLSRPLRLGTSPEFAAHLSAFGMLLPERRLAIDVGTGDGALLEILAPMFERVIAVDRSVEQLEIASMRARHHDYDNVTFVRAEIGSKEPRAAVDVELAKRLAAGDVGRKRDGADVVFASRVLHHAASPADALHAIVELASRRKGDQPGGAVCVVDYEAHDDSAMRDEADVWLGFDAAELRAMAEGAGLVDVQIRRLPAAWRGEGPDRHLPWQLLVGWRGDAPVQGSDRKKKGTA
jgi:ArsR family transcriptional regulator